MAFGVVKRSSRSVGFGVVHGDICGAHEGGAIPAMVGSDGHTKTGPHVEAQTGYRYGGSAGGEDVADDDVEVGAARHDGDHCELIATEPADRTFTVNGCLQLSGDLSENRVSAFMAERIVDCFEPVEVDQHHGDD